MTSYLLYEDAVIVEKQSEQVYILLEDQNLMADQIEIQLPRTIVNEQTSFTLTTYFRIRSTSAADAPTTIDYRVDCLSTKREITDWKSVTPVTSSNDIVITATENKILDDAHNIEIKQITIRVDSGLATQVIKPAQWKVRNLLGIT